MIDWNAPAFRWWVAFTVECACMVVVVWAGVPWWVLVTLPLVAWATTVQERASVGGYPRTRQFRDVVRRVYLEFRTGLEIRSGRRGHTVAVQQVAHLLNVDPDLVERLSVTVTVPGEPNGRPRH